MATPTFSQTVTFPQPITRLTVCQSDEKYSDEEYWAFCEANRNLHIERTAQGEIIIMPPAGGESDYRNAEVVGVLSQWSKSDGRGKAFGPTVQYFLPDGSGLSPDASWVSNESLARLTKQQRRKYLPLVPEFVIEVMSSTDRLKDAKAKMEVYIRNGVELAWFIDGDERTVTIYRQGQPAETRRGIEEIAGEGPVEGFVLNLRPIWEGL
jgi:Uma2 family endonuclease